MKKSCLLLLAALLLSQLASAQQLRFGAKAGATYATFLNDLGRNTRVWGANAGVFARYALSADGFWNLQPELLYAGKGTDLSDVPRYHTRLHYVDLPVLLHVNARGLLFEAGTQLSTIVANTQYTPFGKYHSDRSTYAALQLGYAVGLGYELAAGPSLTIRYTNDLTRLRADNGSNGNRNSVFQAQLGYLLGGRK